MPRFFQFSEFKCRCGQCDGGPLPSPLLLSRLDRWRDGYGAALLVSSGSRCAAYNAKVGGKPDSAHLTGEAADIIVPYSSQRFKLLDLALAGDLFNRIGVGSNFLHVDVSTTLPQHVCWVYPAKESRDG